MDELSGETCPLCLKKTLTLRESEQDVPYFGTMYVFSMTCTDQECGYSVSDVEFADEQEPCRYDFEVSCEADLNARVIKGSAATVRIGRIATIEPGASPDGYVSTIEGVLVRLQDVLEQVRDSEDDPDQRKRAKNQLKKILRILSGHEPVTITLLDPTGNSAIIHEKAKRSKLKK
jgi:zinc finger protein